MTIEKLVKILTAHNIIFTVCDNSIITESAWIPKTGEIIKEVITVIDKVVFVNNIETNIYSWLGY